MGEGNRTEYSLIFELSDSKKKSKFLNLFTQIKHCLTREDEISKACSIILIYLERGPVLCNLLSGKDDFCFSINIFGSSIKFQCAT